MACNDLNYGNCDDTCTTYDLCEVVVKSNDSCVPNGRIVCEGFKFNTKVDSETKSNSACYEAYGYNVKGISYEWEITNPCDKAWFDHRVKSQLCDKYSMEITGYVQEECGNFKPVETLTACFIDETGREYGGGVSRSIKGKALHHKVYDDRTSTVNGVTIISNSSSYYLEKYSTNIRNRNRESIITALMGNSYNGRVGGIGAGSGGGGGGAF